MSKLLIATGIVAAALSLGACENMSSEDKGTAGGAVLGGVAGSAATGGSTIGTIGGTVGGAVLGREAGREYEERKDR
jgi:osmotically inducible lipoprotein OsmB